MRTTEERAERILQEADRLRAKKRRTAKIVCSLSAVCAVAIAFNLTLFVPYSTGGVDLSAYRGSEYFTLMSKIGELTYPKTTTNNFERWGLSSLIPDKVDKAEPESPSASDAPEGNGSYAEVTNNQTEGVIEGDLCKRTDQYAWYLGKARGETSADGYAPVCLTLSCYSIAGTDAGRVSYLTISPESGTDFCGDAEMFLSADASTVTVVSPFLELSDWTRSDTAVLSVDVSNPSEPKELTRTYLSGRIVSSRMKDDGLLLVTDLPLRKPDFSDEKSYLPTFGALSERKPLPMQDIVLPENATQIRYTVVAALENGAVTDALALFSCTGDVYVSENDLFPMRTYTDVFEENGKRYLSNATEIYRIGYGDGGLELFGSFSVRGQVENRFSLDEKDGVLRIFTTSSLSPVSESTYDMGDRPALDLYYSDTRCDLFCVRLDGFETVAAVKDFAPEGESVRSVRFKGDRAYVCTSLWLVDPVFEFDLSDYAHITQTNTGTIPGYSIHLIPFCGDSLLGVGYGETGRFKAEIYSPTGETVLSLAKYEQDVEFSEEYKDCFVDREHGLIGISIVDRSMAQFLVLRFDGETLTEFTRLSFWRARAFVQDGILYVLDAERVATVPLP